MHNMENVDLYMSYWSDSYLNWNPNSERNKYVKDLHKLSLYFANKNYKKVTLITDDNGKEWLKDLPFYDIKTYLNDIKNISTPNWALGKLYSYKKISEIGKPFMHFDYDVFLWNKFEPTFFNSDIFVQQEESDLETYALPELYSCQDVNFYDVPHTFTNKEKAYNVGIIGGQDTKNILKYANAAIEFTLDTNNQECFRKMSDVYHSSVACVCEQYYLYYFCLKNNIKVNLLLPEERISRQEKAKNIGYTHLVDLKTNENIKKQIYSLIKEYNL